MDSRKERLKKSLGISEYPWSSDDDENETGHTNPLNLIRWQPGDAPRPSLGEIPGTSSEPPIVPSPTNSPARKAQAKLDREMFWSIINNHAVPRSRVCEAGVSGPSHSARLAATAPAAVERRARTERSADVQRMITRWKSRDDFLRFTKSLNAMRNRHSTNAYPVYSRSSSGPSRNPLFNQSMSAEVPIIKTNRGHVTKRLYNCRPDYSSINRRSAGSTAGTSGLEARPAGPAPGLTTPDLQETFNIDLSDDDLEASRVPAAPTRDANATADRSEETIEEGHDTSGGATSDEPAAAPAPPDAVDGADRQAVDDVTAAGLGAEATDAVPSTSQHARDKRRREESEDGTEQLTVKEFNQSLLRLLECPVCLEWMEPPIAQCRRGHLVCTTCRARLAACPVCRTTFSSVRNRAMEGVSELLRYPCRHGCGRSARLRRRGAHEASCAARKYQCPVAACAQRPPLAQQDLATHFQSKHLDVLKIGRKHKISMKVSSEQHVDWLVMALHELFHLRVDADLRGWGVLFYVAFLGPKANAKDYTYTITVNGQHNSKKLSYARVTHSDLERSSLSVSRQDCFHLTLDQALNFLRFKNRHCDPDKYLDFSVEISKTEEDEENKETQET